MEGRVVKVVLPLFLLEMGKGELGRGSKKTRQMQNFASGANSPISSSSGARSGTDIGDHASPNISVIRQLQKI